MTQTHTARKDGMNEYRMKFVGREKGAIGIFYPMDITLVADCPDSAREKLYDRYEHIQHLEMRAI